MRTYTCIPKTINNQNHIPLFVACITPPFASPRCRWAKCFGCSTRRSGCHDSPDLPVDLGYRNPNELTRIQTMLSPEKTEQQSAGCSNFFEGFPRHRLDSMGWDPCAVFLDHLKDCLKTTVCDTCHILNASKRRQHIATAFLFYFLGCYVAKGAGIWRPATRLDHTGNGGFRLSGLPGRMALNIISQTYGCTAARVLSCSLRILEI